MATANAEAMEAECQRLHGALAAEAERGVKLQDAMATAAAKAEKMQAAQAAQAAQQLAQEKALATGCAQSVCVRVRAARAEDTSVVGESRLMVDG